MIPLSTSPKKPIIGLTGTIGAGKTEVGKILADLGCAVISADALAHQILEEAPAKEFITNNFGPGVLDADGRVNRKKIGELVFSDAAKLRLLEGFIHPEVKRRQAVLIDGFQADSEKKAIVLDVPLLIESGLKHLCDWVILVDADREIRQKRVGQSRGWSKEELARREKFFYSICLKRSVADAIVYNNSTIEACRQQVETILSRIISSVPCQLA
jgi:dephospho-CoA kinase